MEAPPCDLQNLKTLDVSFLEERSRSFAGTETADMWKRQSVKFNLLKNPCALENLDQWTIDEGDDGWSTKNMPGDGEEHFPNPSVTKYFVTPFRCGKKSQLIDLKEMGFSDEIMDKYQPGIIVTDWFAGNTPWVSDYQLVVQLLSKDKIPLQQFSPPPVIIGDELEKVVRGQPPIIIPLPPPPFRPHGTHWHHITHTFTDYGKGVRYVHFEHGGKDIKCCANWFGVRMTNSSVSIDM